MRLQGAGLQRPGGTGEATKPSTPGIPATLTSIIGRAAALGKPYDCMSPLPQVILYDSAMTNIELSSRFKIYTHIFLPFHESLLLGQPVQAAQSLWLAASKLADSQIILHL